MSVLVVFHILVCLSLIGLVLLQDPKGGSAGGVFGGGSSASLLGATGAVSLLQKVTRYMAIAFAATCIWLTVWTRPDGGSVTDVAIPVPAGAPVEAPIAVDPAQEAGPAEGSPTQDAAPAQTEPAPAE